MNTIDQLTQQVDLHLLKKIMLGLSGVVFILISLDYCQLYSGKTNLQPASKQSDSLPKPLVAYESFETYQSSFERSAFFGNLISAGVPVIRASIQELTKDYRLKGVILSGDPEAIIEDARTQQTVFYHKGQKLGDLEVSAIHEGVVVLTYLGEEIKLEMT